MQIAGQNGREDRIRTCGPLVPNQMRYQTAPLPEKSLFSCPGSFCQGELGRLPRGGFCRFWGPGTKSIQGRCQKNGQFSGTAEKLVRGLQMVNGLMEKNPVNPVREKLAGQAKVCLSFADYPKNS